MSGRRLGAYELLEEIGRGGMAVVYRAVQPSLRRTVAVKVLAARLSSDEEFVERFLREARAAARLDHPGIVTVHEVGESEGTYFFAMQLLSGQSLSELLLDRGRLEPVQVASVGIQIADALSYAHREGILHRDIKPANLVIDRTGRCVLTDFGIALAASETRLTRTGVTLGTPDYTAPEILSGGQADARSDLYSLGIVLFQALTGQVPYRGASAISVARQHVTAPLPRARDFVPAVPEEMDRILARLMAKDPVDRYQSAAEVVDDLLQVTRGVIPSLAAAEGQGRALSASPAAPTPSDRSGERRGSRARRAWLLALVALALAAGLYLVLARACDRAAPPTPVGMLSIGGG